MALEDAVCLSHCLAQQPDDMERALASYTTQRLVRTAHVQLQSRALGEHIYHPAGAHAMVRNAIMSAKTSEDYYGHLAWLYGGTGLSSEQSAA
jgi:3-hydroxybenzoate 6-monooxygenase